MDMEKHNEAVQKIAARVKEFHKIQKPFRIYHGSTNSTRQSPYRLDNTVDTSALSNVLKIDKAAKKVLVEPNVPMDKFVEATLEHNLLPLVVMEFPGITVGGGFAGTGGESSSFRHSYFDQTVESIEIVLADGEIVKASEKENSDLFRGTASSFGTLGITTMVEVRLRDAERYVSLSYRPISSIDAAVAEIKEAISRPDADFVDGILFSKNTGVICVGHLTSDGTSGYPVQPFSRKVDPWFYLHARDVYNKNKSSPSNELVPVRDYLFRYDRGAFWMGSYAYKYFLMPFNRFTRWMLDWLMRTRVLYHAMHKSGLSKKYIIQDVGIPFDGAKEFVNYLDTSFKQYPIWLCPLLQTENSPMSPHSMKEQTSEHSNTLLNFGVWGLGPRTPKESVEVNRELEGKVRSLGGKKWLYANAYYTEEEFWSMYDKKTYDMLRTKYRATYLPSVYDKVTVNLDMERNRAAHPILDRIRSGYAVIHTLLSSNYLMQRQTSEPSKAAGEK